MFIILSSRIRNRVWIRGFFKNSSESVRLQDFEIRNNTTAESHLVALLASVPKMCRFAVDFKNNSFHNQLFNSFEKDI